MKSLFPLLIAIIGITNLTAQNHYAFHADAPQGFSIERSTPEGLSLHYGIHEIGIADIDNGEAQGHEIVLNGCFAPNAEGRPNLPFANRYIAVPQGAQVSVEVKEKASKTLGDITLLPAAPLQMNGDDRRPPLRWDMDIFGKDADFPSENVVVAQTTQIRNLDVVLLSVTPFRYNPVRKTLEVIYDIDIEVRFEGGNGQFGDPRYRNPAWDNLLRDLVVNGDMLPEAHYYDFLNEALHNREEGCEYLIIAPDDPAILAWADTLKQFRLRQGIPTKIVTTTECGSNDTEDVRNYILNAYYSWAIPPAAVLLFGENHKGAPEFGIKPFNFISPPSYGHAYTYPSDNPFADMNGDSIPDLAVSRIVAKYPSEYQQQVEKLIQYELNPPTDPHYYDHPVITSGYEEDKWFLITSQIINSYFCDKLERHPTNNYMVFDQGNPFSDPPDSLWSTGENTQAVLDYFGPNGLQYIPSSVGNLDHWGSMTDPQALIDAMSEGGFLTLYRDHSSEDSWACPMFDAQDIAQIHADWPTFIFSIGCLTNNYWDNWTTCLSETFLKAEPGAIGVIGAASVTYSHFNDIITWGMLDYLWPDFMPTLGSQTVTDFAYPAYALVAGKLFLSQQSFRPYASWPTETEKTLNLFNFLGETYLNLFTEVPQPLNVAAAAYHSENLPEYTITAEEGTLVCIARGEEILHLVLATGQAQTFVLPTMAAGEQFDVTVTHPGRIRFHRNVTVIPATGPYMIMEGYLLRDDNANDTLEFGEAANIDLMLFNAGFDMAENTSINLVCESPYVEILNGTATCPMLEADSRVTLQNAFSFKLRHDIPDQTAIDFKLILDNGTVIQEIDFQRIASAPILGILSAFTLTTDEQRTTHIPYEGTTEITFTIYNYGQTDSGPFIADFEVMAPFITVQTPRIVVDNLPTSSTRTLTFAIETLPNDIGGAWLQAKLSLSMEALEVVFEPSLQYGGIFENFESDTLNPFFSWENSANYPWYYSDTDAGEGRRCMETTPPKNRATRLLLSTEGYIPEGKMSFLVKTGQYGTNSLETMTLKEKTASGTKTQTFSSADWRYWEATVFPECETLDFEMVMNGEEEFGIRLDDLCFPPPHTPMAYAGDDLLWCKDTPVELSHAYAYDCDTLFWATDGDGHFENDTIAKTVYYPGAQDFANNKVTLKLNAVGGNGTSTSMTTITLLDEIVLEGDIIGDSVVSKFATPVSHYSIEGQTGVRYLWHMEPASEGHVFSRGNEIDILWNLHANDAEAVLSVTADNGCDAEPISKSIHILGTWLPEVVAPAFSLFPNPTDGKVNLVFDETLQGKATVEVYNLLGERMMTRAIGHPAKGESLTLDLGGLASGLYIIKLNSENGSCSKKVSVR